MKEKIINQILSIILPYAKNGVSQIIKDRSITKDEIEKILEKLNNSLLNIKTQKAKEKVKDFLDEFHDIKYEDVIEDKLLRRAVGLLKYDIIKKREIEKLNEYFAGDFIFIVKKMKKDDFTKIQNLIMLSLGNLDNNKLLTENIVELITVFSFYYLQKFKDKDIYQVMLLLKDILQRIENKEHFELLLQKISNIFVDTFNIKQYMRKAFAGILLGDLILYSIGKGIGIKGKLSVVDFTIFVGTKVVENEIFKKLKKQDVRKIKIKVEKILINF